jgi:hypothetical protein
MLMALGVGRGEIDIGVGEARIEFDRSARQGLRAVVRALIVEQVGKIAAST